MKVVDEVVLPAADMFGAPPALRFRGRGKLYSTCGLCLSLVVLGFAGWLLYYLSHDLIEHKNPTISQLIMSNGAQKPLNLDPEHNTLSFGILDMDYYEYWTDPSVFVMKAGIYIEEDADRNISRQFIELPVEMCEGKLHPGEVYCWKPYTPTGEPIVMGENADMIYFSFEKCTEGATEGVECEEESDINYYLATSRLQMENYVWTIDPEPFTDNFNSSFSPVDYALDPYTYSRKVASYYGKISLQSIQGWLLTDPTVTERVTTISTETDTESLSGSNFLTFQIYRSGTRTIFYKKYQQVQEMLASFTGLLSTVILVAGILALPYVKFKMQEFYVKSCFNVRITGYPPAKPVFSRIPQTPKESSPDSPEDKYIKRERKNLNISFFKWLLSCCKPQPEVKLMETGLAEITPQADIITLIKLSRKVDRLKSLILTEEQRVVFDNLEDPELFLDISKDIKSPDALKINNLPKSYAGNKEKLEQVTKSMREKDETSEINHRLISLYSGESQHFEIQTA